jgi:hypothetical protein
MYARLIFVFDVLSRLVDPTNRALYHSCLQNAMSIISSLVDYQVEHLKQNTSTTNNPFASKLLIKACLDFLLQNVNDIKAPVCLRCLTSLSKVTANPKCIHSAPVFRSNNIDHTWSIDSSWKQQRTLSFVHSEKHPKSKGKLFEAEWRDSTDRISLTSSHRIWPWLFWTFSLCVFTLSQPCWAICVTSIPVPPPPSAMRASCQPLLNCFGGVHR